MCKKVPWPRILLQNTSAFHAPHCNTVSAQSANTRVRRARTQCLQQRRNKILFHGCWQWNGGAFQQLILHWNTKFQHFWRHIHEKPPSKTMYQVCTYCEDSLTWFSKHSPHGSPSQQVLISAESCIRLQFSIEPCWKSSTHLFIIAQFPPYRIPFAVSLSVRSWIKLRLCNESSQCLLCT